MNDFNLYAVNWQDGMLITQKHLKKQEKFLEDLIRWHGLHLGDNYGLVKKAVNGKPALILNMSVNGDRLRVQVSRCQAIAPDGSYIEINESVPDLVRTEAPINETTIPVYVSVNPEMKKQIGDPDPGEDVPRLPYLINQYAVHLYQPPEVPEGQFLQIAELVVDGSEINYSPTYYPPCLAISADDRLAGKAADLRSRLENLLSLSSRAFRAITSTGAFKGESTTLQTAFKDTIYHFINQLAATLDEVLVGRNGLHPLKFTILFKKIFRVFSTLLNLQPLLKDYLNEKLFNRELNTDVGQFLDTVDGYILTEYNHQDIGYQIRMIDEIMAVLRAVIGFLAQTKRDDLGDQAVATETLTYSGRSYRNVAYTAARLEQVGELSYVLIGITEPQPMKDTVCLITKNLFSEAEWKSMQVRLGLNEARGLGETDPIDVDTVSYGNKVALHPRDMLTSSSVKQVTLIFRGTSDAAKFAKLGKMDLLVYAIA